MKAAPPSQIPAMPTGASRRTRSEAERYAAEARRMRRANRRRLRRITLSV